MSVKVTKFEIKRHFFPYILIFLLCKKNRFHVAVLLFSNRSQRTSKCGKNISDTLGCASCATFLNISDTLGCASCATFLFLPHFDVICDLLIRCTDYSIDCMTDWTDGPWLIDESLIDRITDTFGAPNDKNKLPILLLISIYVTSKLPFFSDSPKEYHITFCLAVIKLVWLYDWSTY